MPFAPESLDSDTKRTYWFANNGGVLVASAGFMGLALARIGTAVFGLPGPGVWMDWLLFWGFGLCFLGTACMTADVARGGTSLGEGLPDRLERWSLAILSVTSPAAAAVSLLLLALELTGGP